MNLAAKSLVCMSMDTSISNVCLWMCAFVCTQVMDCTEVEYHVQILQGKKRTLCAINTQSQKLQILLFTCKHTLTPFKDLLFLWQKYIYKKKTTNKNTQVWRDKKEGTRSWKPSVSAYLRLRERGRMLGEQRPSVSSVTALFSELPKWCDKKCSSSAVGCDGNWCNRSWDEYRDCNTIPCCDQSYTNLLCDPITSVVMKLLPVHLVLHYYHSSFLFFFF